jgi:hypothetical protein
VTFHGKNRINGASAASYRLMKKEFSGGIVIPPVITSSWARNLPEE